MNRAYTCHSLRTDIALCDDTFLCRKEEQQIEGLISASAENQSQSCLASNCNTTDFWLHHFIFIIFECRVLEIVWASLGAKKILNYAIMFSYLRAKEKWLISTLWTNQLRCWRKGKWLDAIVSVHINFQLSHQERESVRQRRLKIKDGRSKVLWLVSQDVCV